MLKKHIGNLESLGRKKEAIAEGENQRMMRMLTLLDLQIKDVYGDIVDLAEKSSAFMQRERENPMLMKNVIV